MTREEIAEQDWMRAAARELRIKIHNMNGDDPTNSSDNAANKKWLDSISSEDAQIIAKHFSRADSERVKELREALELAKNLAINADDFLHLTYRIDTDEKRKEIGGGLVIALREFRKKAELLLGARAVLSEEGRG